MSKQGIWKVVEGKHFKIYRKWNLPSRAEQLRRALEIAEKLGVHEKYIYFVPCKFTLQLHGWGIELKLPYLKAITDLVRVGKIKTRSQIDTAKLKRDLLKVKHIAWNWSSYGNKIDSKLGGKWHWDIRIRKLTAPNWFGVTLFNAPWVSSPEKKTMGTIKGFEKLTKAGRRLRTKEELWAEAHGVKFSDIKWTTVDNTIFLPGEEGSIAPRDIPAFMVALEIEQPAILHRRDFDFLDITFIGKKLKGRYYDRLVKRAVSEEEKPQYLKGKETFEHQWFWWKAADQFDLELMKEVAEGKTKLMERRLIK